VNRREDTGSDNRRLVLWGSLVSILIALAYISRAASGKPSPNILYQWSTAAGELVQDAVLLLIVLWIARFSRSVLALRRPFSLSRAARLVGGSFVAIYIFVAAYSGIFHPGNEQGLTPSNWQPHHAAAYIVNSILICTWIPFVEELTYRGVGYSALERFGRWPAILGVGLIFGLSHGLVTSLPVIVAFGCILAWIRSETGSVFPGMVLHGMFNLTALVVAVTVSHH
jgi:membrane protease YdiL (CAAX protease family)